MRSASHIYEDQLYTGFAGSYSSLVVNRWLFLDVFICNSSHIYWQYSLKLVQIEIFFVLVSGFSSFNIRPLTQLTQLGLIMNWLASQQQQAMCCCWEGSAGFLSHHTGDRKLTQPGLACGGLWGLTGITNSLRSKSHHQKSDEVIFCCTVFSHPAQAPCWLCPTILLMCASSTDASLSLWLCWCGYS